MLLPLPPHLTFLIDQKQDTNNDNNNQKAIRRNYIDRSFLINFLLLLENSPSYLVICIHKTYIKINSSLYQLSINKLRLFKSQWAMLSGYFLLISSFGSYFFGICYRLRNFIIFVVWGMLGFWVIVDGNPLFCAYCGLLGFCTFLVVCFNDCLFFWGNPVVIVWIAIFTVYFYITIFEYYEEALPSLFPAFPPKFFPSSNSLSLSPISSYK